jgi:hypothetical protein
MRQIHTSVAVVRSKTCGLAALGQRAIEITVA